MEENLATPIVIRVFLGYKPRFFEVRGFPDPKLRDGGMEYVKSEILSNFSTIYTTLTILLTYSDSEDEGLDTFSIIQMQTEILDVIADFKEMSFDEIETLYSLCRVDSAISFGDLIYQARNV